MDQSDGEMSDKEFLSLIREFRMKRKLWERIESEIYVLWGRFSSSTKFQKIREKYRREKVMNDEKEKIISLKIKVSKVIEIPHLNVILEEAEGVIEKWVEQKIEIGDAYTIEGMTDSGRTIEFMRRDSQPVSVEAKPGIFQRMFSYFK